MAEEKAGKEHAGDAEHDPKDVPQPFPTLCQRSYHNVLSAGEDEHEANQNPHGTHRGGFELEDDERDDDPERTDDEPKVSVDVDYYKSEKKAMRKLRPSHGMVRSKPLPACP